MDISGWLGLAGFGISAVSIFLAIRADKRVREVHEHSAIDWVLELDPGDKTLLLLRNTGVRTAWEVDVDFIHMLALLRGRTRISRIDPGETESFWLIDSEQVMKLPNSVLVSWRKNPNHGLYKR